MNALPLALVAASMLACSPLFAGNPDFEIEQKITFTLEEEEKGYVLSSLTEINQTFLSKRSTEVRVFPVSEHFFDTITELRARFRDAWLDDDRFSFEQNPSEDVFISDYKVRTFSLPHDIDTGESLFYSYRKEYSSIAFLPIVTVPNIDYVKEFTVVIEHPENLRIDFDLFFPGAPFPYTIDSSQRSSTTIRFANLRQRKVLPAFPFNGLQAAVQIHVRDGAREINQTSTREFTAWYRGLFNQTPTLAPRYDTLLASRIASASGAREKLRIIHDYVRGTIRYIADEGAIHAFVPRSPSLVLERGYGDCKDRAYLVSTLARRHGIPVSMALVSTDPRPSFQGTHVTQFNHVICAYRDGAQTIFFDPTDKYCSFDDVPEHLIGAEALVLDPERPERIEIKPRRATPAISVSIDAALAEPKKGRAKVTLRGDYLEAALQAREKSTGLELENILSNMLTREFQKLSFDYFEFESQSDSAIVFRAQADLSDFFIASTTRMYIPQMPFRMIDAEVLQRESDSLAIYTDSRPTISMAIDLDAAGFRGEASSSSFGEERAARFAASLTPVAPGRVRVEYDLRQRSRRMHGQTRDLYLDFCRAFLKSKKNMITLTKSDSQ